MSKQEIDLSNKPVSEWNNIIDEWVYSERDRALMKRRLLDGIPYEPLSAEFDLSVRQTKRIIADRLYDLIKHI